MPITRTWSLIKRSLSHTSCSERPDTQGIVEGTADVNLTILNRLTEQYQIEVEGKTSLAARQVWTINDAVIQPSNRDVFLYAVTHSFSESGYTQSIVGIP